MSLAESFSNFSLRLIATTYNLPVGHISNRFWQGFGEGEGPQRVESGHPTNRIDPKR